MRKIVITVTCLIVFNICAISNEQVSADHVEIPFNKFFQSYEDQTMDKWCWAACISMVFKYYGHPISQEKIVSSVFGLPVNMPAGAGVVIAQQLNRQWQDENGRNFRSHLVAAYDLMEGESSLNNRVLVKELREGHPIIIGVGSHAVVLTGVDYDTYPNGTINVTRAIVFDPWPGIGVRHLTQQEMIPNYPYGYSFAATVRIVDKKSNIENDEKKANDSIPKDKPFSYFIVKCEDGFDSLKGEEEEPGSAWISNELFPGARWTTIDRDEGIDCLRASFVQDTKNETKEVFDQLVEWAKTDLGDSWKSEIKKDNSSVRLWWRAEFSKLSERIKVRITWLEASSGKQRIFIRFENK